MQPTGDFYCMNSDCPDYGKRGAGNLAQRGWSGHKKQIRLLYCRTCGTYFSERKGTLLEHCRLPLEKALSVLEHLAEGCGVRQTARLVKVNRNTVCRLNALAGDRAKQVSEELMALFPSGE